ncbi:putative Zinc metalloproteinase nas-4 [Hypsibius exemplaris]|uniref:Metalloendopeptidase n=1 Tax=Hypsibius exemplaris TaxID=2072580 RepID=A0A9X6NH14_HYPEX|nr:putative Zinc metalloproteinase nas-4 [Hypsibius exemplaris]
MLLPYVQATTILTPVVCFVSLCHSGPVSLPAAWSFPADWRSRITDDAFQYSLEKAKETTESAFFEGDIKGVDKVAERDRDGFYVSRNAIVDKSMRWKDGIVPYEISSVFTAPQKRLIEDALRDIMAKTCVRFVVRRSEPDYISFVNRGMGCSSYVARTGGQQTVDLMPGCLTYIGEPQHEVMHALGFFHEQSRTDRDQYVTIVWNNLVAGAADQFKVYRTDNLDMPYDYASIMHYGWNYFAKDRDMPSIIPKTTAKVALGTRKVMSPIDAEKINRLYEYNGSDNSHDDNENNYDNNGREKTSVRDTTFVECSTARDPAVMEQWLNKKQLKC